MVVVLDAAQTESVLFGQDGIVPLLREGAVVMTCATVPPAFARDMAERCAASGVHCLDAPISGGSIEAAGGALSIMAAGPEIVFDAAQPILNATARTVFRLGGEAGAGSAMKAVNQLLAGVHVTTMAEAMTFGMTQGVTPDAFLRVISQCAGNSWMPENRARHTVDGDYGPRSSVNIWPKDLGNVLDIAAEAEFGSEDDAAVAKIYAKQAGVALPHAKADHTNSQGETE